MAAVASLPASSQKRLDDGAAARFTNANFQEVSSTHPGGGGGAKDGLTADPGKAAAVVAAPEAKGKKNSGGGHGVGPRGGRKSLTSSGKPLPSAVVTMATSSTSASPSTGPFHQGTVPGRQNAKKWFRSLSEGAADELKDVVSFERSHNATRFSLVGVIESQIS